MSSSMKVVTALCLRTQMYDGQMEAHERRGNKKQHTLNMLSPTRAPKFLGRGLPYVYDWCLRISMAVHGWAGMYLK
ncbi:hypothetical protein BDR05DRAFT_965722 [Suillus weaverae]|nr:hypothetical protein BDR05DRAFT_965722 [Suillus weaverae]